MVKISEKQTQIIQQLVRPFGFDNIDDTNTIPSNNISFKKTSSQIKKMKQQIIDEYPRHYTRALRKSKELSIKLNLSILRSILRCHGKHLYTDRKYQWNKQLKKPQAVYYYTILSKGNIP